MAAILTKFNGTVKVRSVANPALWYFSVSMVCYVLVIISGREPPLVMTFAVYASLVLALATIIWFSVANPDRLQSDEFQINQQTLKMIAEKGTKQQKADVANVFVV